MPDRLPPEEYTGESLCVRCGAGADTGKRYATCTDGYRHEDTCKHYQYRDLCPTCDQIVMGEVVSDADTQ